MQLVHNGRRCDANAFKKYIKWKKSDCDHYSFNIFEGNFLGCLFAGALYRRIGTTLDRNKKRTHFQYVRWFDDFFPFSLFFQDRWRSGDVSKRNEKSTRAKIKLSEHSAQHVMFNDFPIKINCVKCQNNNYLDPSVDVQFDYFYLSALSSGIFFLNF